MCSFKIGEKNAKNILELLPFVYKVIFDTKTNATKSLHLLGMIPCNFHLKRRRSSVYYLFDEIF